MNSTANEITGLLNAWAEGRQTAAQELFPLIERELHQIAREHMRRQQPGHTLQTTALVNEAYLRLAGSKPKSWKDRRHFFAVASMAMRHILTDHARRVRREKRGAGKINLRLEEATIVPVEPSIDLVALDEALRSFAKLDSRAAQVVELRFFGGFSVKETAEEMGLSPATVNNDWKAARLWLMQEIDGRTNEP